MKIKGKGKIKDVSTIEKLQFSNLPKPHLKIIEVLKWQELQDLLQLLGLVPHARLD